MPIYKAAVHIPARTGLPRDEAVNTLYFQSPASLTSGDMNALLGIVSTFYTHRPVGSGTSISDYISQDRDPTLNAARIDLYLAPATKLTPEGKQSPWGSPQHTLRFTWTAPTNAYQPLPDQVACVMSYRADLTGVINARKYRGRIFLGPLNALSMMEAASANGAQTVNQIMLNAIGGAAKEILHTAVESLSSGVKWVMFSQTDWAARTIVEVSIDDRFDTQRGRLVPSTGRFKFPIP